NSASMTRDDYDQTLLGGLTSPVKGLQMTRPVVIIDEPHRFARDNKFLSSDSGHSAANDRPLWRYLP
ncbi:type III restriction-modification system StyLTI enzyme res, partial [Salmonella enterica subsp. enterica serovar Enteritidis str. 22704]